MTDHRLQAARARYAAEVARQSRAEPALRDRIERAFAAAPRERFLGPSPWTILSHGALLPATTDDPAEVHQNALVVINRARGINNGEPFLHGLLLAALDPHPGERTLHIGCGTVYYTAILAELVAPGLVTGYEIEEDLAARASEYLRPWGNVDVQCASGASGGLPATDLVYVSAGASRPADAWLDALNDGGRLVFPLVGARGVGVTLKVSRRGRVFDAAVISTAAFIACAGASDREEAKRVGADLDRNWGRIVRSLHRDAAADDTAVVVGNGWWLSTKPPQ